MATNTHSRFGFIQKVCRLIIFVIRLQNGKYFNKHIDCSGQDTDSNFPKENTQREYGLDHK